MKTKRLTLAAAALALVLLPACSDDGGTAANDASSGGAFGNPGGQGAGIAGGVNPSSGGAQPFGGAGPSFGGSFAGATGFTGGGPALGGAGGVGAGGLGTGGLGAGGSGPPGPISITSAIGANTTTGLDWTATPGASGYALYWSTTPGVTPATGQRALASGPSWVHRGLTNGTPYYYVVAPVIGGVEGAPSPEATATPGGEWVLEELGAGLFEDVRTGTDAPRVAVADRIHILLFGEGYTPADLAQLHTVGDHDGGRSNDVDRWVDLVFGIEPYQTLRQAFVVWYLPRASNAHIEAGATAFAVPIIAGPGVGQVASDGETARLAWEAIATFPFAPTNYDGPSSGTARNLVTPFLIFNPSNGRAGVSGRALSLRNPANTSQRVASCFGVGHAHEFTHAFSSLRDEYLEDDNTAPSQWSSTSNVAGTSACGEVPWAHLLSGGSINPGQGNLVGAFGRPQHGYHSELLCLLNGTHDNAAYYGGSGLLRVEDRMCNFCREMTALRTYQRAGLVASGTTGFDTWTAEYRAPFFTRHPFAVPSVVPQTNDPRNPGQGTPIYEACTAASVEAPPELLQAASEDRRPSGCVLDDSI